MKKQIIKFIVLFAFSAISISCNNDFLDVNDDPTKPSVSSPGQTLPAAQQELLDIYSTSMNPIGNYMAYNWASPSNRRPNTVFIKYEFTPESLDAINDIWNDSYINLFKDLLYIENFEQDGLDYSAYKAIAKTMKAFQYQYLVDLYGNIPYTEANNIGSQILTPVFDNAKTIYKDLIDKLTEAAITATNLPAGFENPSIKDIIFKGDMQKWAQFANTIKLRFLIRMSGTGQDNAYITSQIAKINSNGAGYITEDVTGNPGYSDNVNKQNLFFSIFGQRFGTGKILDEDKDINNSTSTTANKLTVASDFAINYLTITNDPRINRLYTFVPKRDPRGTIVKGANRKPVSIGFKGAPQSATLPNFGFRITDLSHLGPGLLVDSEQDQPLMLHSEALLLQAEAMVRGYISGGDAAAKLKYEEAIKSSFNSLGVPDVNVATTTYLAQNLPNVAWDSSTDKLEAIATQKWVALNGVSGAELWIETTRTGFPLNLPISQGNTNSLGKRPVRLLYPLSEIEKNPKNVPPQTKDAAFTHIPFWKN